MTVGGCRNGPGEVFSPGNKSEEKIETIICDPWWFVISSQWMVSGCLAGLVPHHTSPLSHWSSSIPISTCGSLHKYTLTSWAVGVCWKALHRSSCCRKVLRVKYVRNKMLTIMLFLVWISLFFSSNFILNLGKFLPTIQSWAKYQYDYMYRYILLRLDIVFDFLFDLDIVKL